MGQFELDIKKNTYSESTWKRNGKRLSMSSAKKKSVFFLVAEMLFTSRAIFWKVNLTNEWMTMNVQINSAIVRRAGEFEIHFYINFDSWFQGAATLIANSAEFVLIQSLFVLLLLL